MSRIDTDKNEAAALAIDHRGGTTIVRFVRPEIRNPLSVFVVEELQSILDELPASCERLILTGSGDAFASGADLREIGAIEPDGVRAFAELGQRLMSSVAACKAKTVAAINGYCFGGALDLAVNCDTRVAAPQAMFSHPGTSLGIITGWSGTQRLPRLIGEARSLEMFLTAGRFTAEQALAFGLIDHIADDVLAVAMEIG